MDTLPVLCLLGILCSLAVTTATTVPPEDLDGSGDDEDFSGSGSDGLLVDLESKDVMVSSTSVSTLFPTVEGSTAAQEPNVVDKKETKIEVTTKSAETTKSHDEIIEDLFAFDTFANETMQEATSTPTQLISTAVVVEEVDAKKHDHHHHHHHHHNHTTTHSPSTTESDGLVDDTTDIPIEQEEPIGVPEHTTTSTPDIDPAIHNVPQQLTTPSEDLIEREETTAGSTSTYADNEGPIVDVDLLPDLDSLVTTTVAKDSHTQTHHPHHHHHHHHHHPHNYTTTSSDVQQEETTTPSGVIVPGEGDDEEAEHTTPVAEDKHHHHGHHHHPHHKTTTSPTVPTEPEIPTEAHTHEPKGRRVVGVPDVETTTAIPVINEEEHFPEDSERDDIPSSTVQYNISSNPLDEIDESSDSKEEGPSGVTDEELYFEPTVGVVIKGRMNNAPIDASIDEASADDGTSNASHGIMERKELLAGIIAGGVAGLVFAAFLVAFVLYRMKKKDEGSYSLEEPKPSNNGYQKPREQKEFYA